MPPRRRNTVGAVNNSRGVQVETFVLDPKAVKFSDEMFNKLEDNRDLDVRALAQEHRQCPLQTHHDMKAFCSSFLMRMIVAEDTRRAQYAKLACELMIVWSNPITHNGQEDSFVRRLHEVTQDAFEAMDANDKEAARGFAVTLGEFYKANVLSQKVLGQVMGTLLNDERHEDEKVEWACHIVDACGTALPESFGRSFLEKFEALLTNIEDGRPRIIDAQTKKIAILTVDKLRKLKEERQKVRPLCEAYTDLYADLHAVKSKIVGETTSLLQRELDELCDAVDGTGERVAETFQQRLRSPEDVLKDLQAELATLKQETAYLKKEVAAKEEVDKFCEWCLELKEGRLGVKRDDVDAKEQEVLKLTSDVRCALNVLGKPHEDSLAVLAKSLNTKFTEQLSKDRAEIAKILSPWTEARKLLQDLLDGLQACR
jgi:hypothetical protein